MKSTWKRGGNREGLEICNVFVDSFIFKQKIYCSFLRMAGVGVGVKKLVILYVHHKWMTPKFSNKQAGLKAVRSSY